MHLISDDIQASAVSLFISDAKMMSRSVWNVGYETSKILKGAIHSPQTLDIISSILLHVFF
jgi:hypothetical protein